MTLLDFPPFSESLDATMIYSSVTAGVLVNVVNRPFLEETLMVVIGSLGDFPLISKTHKPYESFKI